jgi:hypothetical protein
MSWICRRYREMILNQTLDARSDSKSRHKLEQHLSHCPHCRAFSQNTQDWFAFRDDWRAQKEKAEPSEGFPDRIIAAIRQEAAQQSLQAAIPAKRPGRMIYLNRAAGIAVAALLVVAGIQLLAPKKALNTADGTSLGEQAMSTQANVKTASTTEPIKYIFSSAPGSWQIYGGSLSGKAVADCTASGAREDGFSYEEIIRLLGQPVSLHIFTRQTDALANESQNQPSILILAEYPSDAAAQMAEQVKLSLSSCETPVRIEIIRIDDLPTLVSGLDSDTLAELSAHRADASSWILILIGE